MALSRGRRPRISWSEPAARRPPEIPRENEHRGLRLREHSARHSLGDAARVRAGAGRGLLRHHGRLYDARASLLPVDSSRVDAVAVDDHYSDPRPIRLAPTKARPPVRPDEPGRARALRVWAELPTCYGRSAEDSRAARLVCSNIEGPPLPLFLCGGACVRGVLFMSSPRHRRVCSMASARWRAGDAMSARLTG